MNTKANIIQALAAIAAANPEGYTVDARTLQPITRGYAVAVSATQDNFGREGLENVVGYVLRHNDVNAFGGWLDKETEKFYYDAVIVVNRIEEAYVLAKFNGQIAFFDLENYKEVNYP